VYSFTILSIKINKRGYMKKFIVSAVKSITACFVM
jgi:hypothetical protein